MGLVSICKAGFALFTLTVLLPDNGANAVNISAQHSQGHIALKASDAMVWTDI